ncbi:hypothetical protein E2320_022068, partial [Naja naja]
MKAAAVGLSGQDSQDQLKLPRIVWTNLVFQVPQRKIPSEVTTRKTRREERNLIAASKQGFRSENGIRNKMNREGKWLDLRPLLENVMDPLDSWQKKPLEKQLLQEGCPSSTSGDFGDEGRLEGGGEDQATKTPAGFPKDRGIPRVHLFLPPIGASKLYRKKIKIAKRTTWVPPRESTQLRKTTLPAIQTIQPQIQMPLLFSKSNLQNHVPLQEKRPAEPGGPEGASWEPPTASSPDFQLPIQLLLQKLQERTTSSNHLLIAEVLHSLREELLGSNACQSDQREKQEDFLELPRIQSWKHGKTDTGEKAFEVTDMEAAKNRLIRLIRNHNSFLQDTVTTRKTRREERNLIAASKQGFRICSQENAPEDGHVSLAGSQDMNHHFASPKDLGTSKSIPPKDLSRPSTPPGECHGSLGLLAKETIGEAAAAGGVLPPLFWEEMKVAWKEEDRGIPRVHLFLPPIGASKLYRKKIKIVKEPLGGLQRINTAGKPPAIQTIQPQIQMPLLFSKSNLQNHPTASSPDFQLPIQLLLQKLQERTTSSNHLLIAEVLHSLRELLGAMHVNQIKGKNRKTFWSFLGFSPGNMAKQTREKAFEVTDMEAAKNRLIRLIRNHNSFPQDTGVLQFWKTLETVKNHIEPILQHAIRFRGGSCFQTAPVLEKVIQITRKTVSPLILLCIQDFSKCSHADEAFFLRPEEIEKGKLVSVRYQFFTELILMHLCNRRRYPLELLMAEGSTAHQLWAPPSV